jgi:hypothetical protein
MTKATTISRQHAENQCCSPKRGPGTKAQAYKTAPFCLAPLVGDDAAVLIAFKFVSHLGLIL